MVGSSRSIKHTREPALSRAVRRAGCAGSHTGERRGSERLRSQIIKADVEHKRRQLSISFKIGAAISFISDNSIVSTKIFRFSNRHVRKIHNALPKRFIFLRF